MGNDEYIKDEYIKLEKKVKSLKLYRTLKVHPVRTTSRYISGSGYPGTYVNAYVGTRRIGKTVKINSSGYFKISIPEQEKNTRIYIKIIKDGKIYKSTNVRVR